MADENTQGRESVFAKPKSQVKMDPGFMDPGFRRDDERGGFRRDNDPRSKLPKPRTQK